MRVQRERHEGDKEDNALPMRQRQRENSQEMSENAWSPSEKRQLGHDSQCNPDHLSSHCILSLHPGNWNTGPDSTWRGKIKAILNSGPILWQSNLVGTPPRVPHLMYLEIPRKDTNSLKTAWLPRDLRTANNQKLGKQAVIVPSLFVECYKNPFLT